MPFIWCKKKTAGDDNFQLYQNELPKSSSRCKIVQKRYLDHVIRAKLRWRVRIGAAVTGWVARSATGIATGR